MQINRYLLILTVVSALAACERETTALRPLADVQHANERVNPPLAYLLELQDTSKYLPYGIPIPPGTVLTKPPQPYNEAVHGPPMANTSSAEPLHASSGPPLHGSSNRRAPFPGDGDYEIFIQNVPGLLVRNDAQRDLVIPTSITGTVLIYAPTHRPHGNACLEMVTRHMKTTNAVTTQHHSTFYDFCHTPNTFWTPEPMNSSFASKYIRLYGVNCGLGCPVVPEEAYYNEIHASDVNNPIDSCWTGMLYNFNTGLWEQKAVSCGTPTEHNRSSGWTLWESWYLPTGTCPTFPIIQAQWIRKLTTSGTWVDLQASDILIQGPGGTGCFANNVYTMTQPNGASGWRALTP